MKHFFYLLLLFNTLSLPLFAKVRVGSELLLTEDYLPLLRGKRIGLVTNHTAMDSSMQFTVDKLKAISKTHGFRITALFAPEHGLQGLAHAGDSVDDGVDPDGIPIYSLHGKNVRPNDAMLNNVDLLIFEIQDIGSRSYTYLATLFYVMEEAATRKIPLIVLDRPNPINGLIVDGPMLEPGRRSIVGYVNVPYCHGMTIGELSKFYNGEYKIGCKLTVVPMEGWTRKMTFADTGLTWIPTSPNIPEATTAYFYPTTGILGELTLVNIGIGYTLPFKLVGAPWINADQFAATMNKQNLPGVKFKPFHYRPFFGKFAQEDCHGILILVSDLKKFKPVTTQYTIIGILKGLYPQQFKEALAASKGRQEMFAKVNGTDEVYRIINQEPYVVWPLRLLHEKQRHDFLAIRQKYLLDEYNER